MTCMDLWRYSAQSIIHDRSSVIWVAARLTAVFIDPVSVLLAGARWVGERPFNRGLDAHGAGCLSLLRCLCHYVSISRCVSHILSCEVSI